MEVSVLKKVTHPEFPEYFIRSDGSVERAIDGKRNSKAGDILRGRVLTSGYRQFKLKRRDGTKAAVRANRLVCEAFHGSPPSPTHHAAHKNGIRLDNRKDNLYWATPLQNKRDSLVHGTAVFGETVINQHGPAKITRQIVMDIRAEYTGRRGEIIGFARRYGVQRTCIQNIVSGQTWRHVPGRSALDRRVAHS